MSDRQIALLRWLGRRWPFRVVLRPFRDALARLRESVENELRSTRQELAEESGRVERLRRDLAGARSEMADGVRALGLETKAISENLHNGLQTIRQEVTDDSHRLDGVREDLERLRAEVIDRVRALGLETKSIGENLENGLQTIRQEFTEDSSRLDRVREDLERLRAEVIDRVRALGLETKSVSENLDNGLRCIREELEQARKSLREEVASSETELLHQIRQEIDRSTQGFMATLRRELASADSHVLSLLRQERENREAAVLATLRRELPSQEQLLEAHATLEKLRQEILSSFTSAQRSVLSMRAFLFRALAGSPAVAEDRRPAAAPSAFEEYFGKMEALDPSAFPVWYELLEAAERVYRSDPEGSCSVEGSAGALAFADFLAPYLTGGWVLDIGCGTQSVPLYLAGYPLGQVAGIDPLKPDDSHPFEFVRGFAEFLPWADDSFDLVIAATSLDHVLSLDRALDEIVRVLAPGGMFAAWVGFVRGAKPYSRDDTVPEPIDEFHLFHFDEGWFEAAMASRFRIREKFCLDRESYFYCLEPES